MSQETFKIDLHVVLQEAWIYWILRYVVVLVVGNVKRTEQRCHIEPHNVGQVCSKHKSGRLILL